MPLAAILIIVSAMWVLLLALVAGACLGARAGDAQRIEHPVGARVGVREGDTPSPPKGAPASAALGSERGPALLGAGGS